MNNLQLRIPLSETKKFNKAPSYRPTLTDIQMAKARRKAAKLKEKLKLKKEFDYFWEE